MKEQLEQRLIELKSEFESSQKMLADLEARQANLIGTLPRTSGCDSGAGRGTARTGAHFLHSEAG